MQVADLEAAVKRIEDAGGRGRLASVHPFLLASGASKPRTYERANCSAGHPGRVPPTDQRRLGCHLPYIAQPHENPVVVTA
jgi:hypothetical protein